MSTSLKTATRPRFADIFRITFAAGLLAAATSDLELYVTTVLPVGGSMANIYRFIADVACGGAVPPINPVLFGLLAHIGISLGWAYGYTDLASRTPALRKAPWISGGVYGLVVLTGMQSILLGVHRFHVFTPLEFANQVVLHCLFFGIPIALTVRKMLDQPASL